MMTNIGKAVKLCRTQKNMTQGELAELAGISTAYLSLIERNKRDPSLSTMQNIAAALNVPLPILIFLVADTDGLAKINLELANKLAHTALELIR